jgi:hypothetical protein
MERAMKIMSDARAKILNRYFALYTTPCGCNYLGNEVFERCNNHYKMIEEKGAMNWSDVSPELRARIVHVLRTFASDSKLLVEFYKEGTLKDYHQEEADGFAAAAEKLNAP